MAQRTEKEETEFVPAETVTLCVSCGNSASTHLCQKCLTSSTTTNATSAKLKNNQNHNLFLEKPITSNTTSSPEKSPEREVKAEVAVKRVVNRCSGCRRKVGLTGFRCRCGDLFCADHRYSDRHECSYDYKTVGREAIARENPVVKAAKIVKI